MLRQLLSNNGATCSGNISSNIEQYNSINQSVSGSVGGINSFENSPTAISTYCSHSTTVLPSNEMKEWNEANKNLLTLENMPLTNGYYGQPSTNSSNHSDQIESCSNDLNDTTELFSSTFAMLSADSSVSWNTWDEQTGFSSSTDEYSLKSQMDNMSGHNFGYTVHTTIPSCSNDLGGDSFTDRYMANCQSLMTDNESELQTMNASKGCVDGDVSGNRNHCIQRKNFAEKWNQMTQSRFSDAYRRLVHIPVQTGFGESDGGVAAGNGEGEQVMCMACHGVYSSRRSLTGHIGRNEKCREIIGRNYLDQMSGIVESMQVTDPGNVINSNGIDPVCPYCDRFISHYKGNIRRHVNQCMKSMRNGSKLRRKDATIKQVSSGSVQYNNDYHDTTFSDSYQPHVLATLMCGNNESSWIDGSNFLTETEQSKWKSNNVNKKDRSNEDPFKCPLCEFTTIYKGNMKRHLSTCHGLQDSDLKDGCIDKLKCKETAVETRLENSTRGRRPKNAQRNILKTTAISSGYSETDSPSSNCDTSKSPLEMTNQKSPSAVYTSTNIYSSCDAKPVDNELSEALQSKKMIEISDTHAVAAATVTVDNDDNDNHGDHLSRSSTIDEAIEAVIANGVESPVSKIR